MAPPKQDDTTSYFFLFKEEPMKRKEKICRMILLFVIKLFYVHLRGYMRLRGYIFRYIRLGGYIYKFLPWIPWSSIPDLPDKLTEMAIYCQTNNSTQIPTILYLTRVKCS